MESLNFDLIVSYDSGEQAKVHIGQRELADWEAQPFGCASSVAVDTKPIMFLRYVAWSYLRRTERLRQGFQAWGEQVESVDPTDDDDEGQQPRRLDPTNRALSGGA